MVKEITPTGVLNARIRLPGSKSVTNRALICAALAEGESVVRNASDSDDTALMANGLNQLGVLVRRTGNTLLVEGTGGKLFAPKFPIPVGDAGTTFRFLVSLAALAKGNVKFDGDRRMAERPIGDLLDALKRLGVETKAQLPSPLCEVRGGSLQGGLTALNGSSSSQFLSSLLMVASYAHQDVIIEVEGALPSIPYVDTTLEVMKQFGVQAEHRDHKRFTIKSGQRYRPSEIVVEPDASAASYFLAAGAIAGGTVLVEECSSSLQQGDVQFIHVLQRMGCEIVETAEGISVKRQSRGVLAGVDVDMNSMPDVVPTLAVVALFAEGKTCIRNVAHLQFKESDRLAALATELQKLGAKVIVCDEGIEIEPGPLHGAQLDTYDDHRLAMSFALIGLRVPGVRIENPDCVRKSFPGFWREFDKLYGK